MKYVQLLLLVISFIVNCHSKCNKIFVRGVSSQDENIILNRHNEIRLILAKGQLSGQPKAANMKRMFWDKTLATAAQNIANTCVFEHVKVSDNRFSVGQNLYWSASTVSNKTANWLEAINSWYNEYPKYKWGATTYNHYTQLVWADTYLVGCGFINYMNKEGWYEKLYVCNYGPAGNYVGQTPYKQGSGCENLC